MSYDNAGNLTTDTYSAAAVTRAYDAENRTTSETQANSYVSGSYSYNADGQRVRRTVGGQPSAVTTWQVYGMEGELLAEYAASAAPAMPQKEYGYRNGQLLITAEAAPPVNLALNKLATQSSTYIYGDPTPNLAVDGNTDGVWLDHSVASTNNEAQAWWQVDLGATVAVQSVEVWNRTDCCPERLSNFNVLLLDGNQATVASVNITGPGGTPTTVAISGTARYVKVQLVGTNFLSLAEVKVWSTAAGAANINWLVTDQLGTPRMIFDKTGALATTKRHDYLPFGEELSAGVGQRTTTVGYGVADAVRQKFTQKERDVETGLDYFLARYYSSTQGRFTSPDEFSGGPDELYILGSGDTEKQALPYAEITNPQSVNKYQYTYGNPLRFTDPNGHCPPCVSETHRDVGAGVVMGLGNMFIGMNNVVAHFGVPGTQHVEPFQPSNQTQRVAMIITEDVTFFASLGRGKPQVGGVLVAETKTTSQVAAMTVANEAQMVGGASRPGAAGALVSATGETVTATTRTGGVNAGVQKVLDSVPQSQRSAFHGKCCEPRLISGAQNAGINLRGAEISVVKVRGLGNPAHGTTMSACSSCRAVLEFYGIKN